jgi:hypothetical protein
VSIPKVYTPIELAGHKLNIVMSYNAWCDVEKATGINPFGGDDEFDLTSPSNVRVMLWAGLRHENPSLTLDDVGDMLDQTPGGFTAALVAVAQALEASLPDEVEIVEAEASAEGNETGSQ